MPFRTFDCSSFTPEELKTLTTAFDLAWADVATQIGADANPSRVEFARNALAHSIFSAASFGAADAESLKTAALATFAGRYKP